MIWVAALPCCRDRGIAACGQPGGARGEARGFEPAAYQRIATRESRIDAQTRIDSGAKVCQQDRAHSGGGPRIVGESLTLERAAYGLDGQGVGQCETLSEFEKTRACGSLGYCIRRGERRAALPRFRRAIAKPEK